MLKLANVKLDHGLAFGGGSAADGGAIFNQGMLTLSGIWLTSNTARGSNVTAVGGAGQNAAGGALWTSGGALTLTGGNWLQHNNAYGGNGGRGGPGGAALGGAIYADLSKLSLAPAVSSRTAQPSVARGVPARSAATRAAARSTLPAAGRRPSP